MMSGIEMMSITALEGVEYLVARMEKHKIGPIEVAYHVAKDLVDYVSVGEVKIVLHTMNPGFDFGQAKVILKGRDETFLDEQTGKFTRAILEAPEKWKELPEDVIHTMRRVLLDTESRGTMLWYPFPEEAVNFDKAKARFLGETVSFQEEGEDSGADTIPDFETLGSYWGTDCAKAPVCGRFYDSISFLLKDRRKVKFETDAYWGRSQSFSGVLTVMTKDPSHLEMHWKRNTSYLYKSIKEFVDVFVNELRTTTNAMCPWWFSKEFLAMKLFPKEERSLPASNVVEVAGYKISFFEAWDLPYVKKWWFYKSFSLLAEKRLPVLVSMIDVKVALYLILQELHFILANGTIIGLRPSSFEVIFVEKIAVT